MPTRQFLLSAMILLAALYGCTPKSLDPEVRTYSVSAENADAVLTALRHVLSDNNQKQIGQVSMLPNNKIIVVAPLPIQSGIASLISQLNSDSPRSSATLKTSYWLIHGEPTTGQHTLNLTGEIQSVGEAILKETGAQNLDLLEQAQILSRDNASVSIEAHSIHVRQTLRSTPMGIDGNVAFRMGGAGPNFETSLNLTLNHPIVIGMMADPQHNGASIYFVLEVTKQ